MLVNNLKKIRNILGKVQQEVSLVAVTKNVPAELVNEALELGVQIIGENRVQEAATKFSLLKYPCEKHMIGHLQTNKVKKALEIFDVIQSVDSLRLAGKISSEVVKLEKTIPIFLEVNISGEEQKYGFTMDEIEESLEKIRKLPNLEIRGLMGMAPYFDDPEKARPYFRRLKKLADKLGLSEISMGMSGDYKVAVEEGATVVRIGRALFSQEILSPKS